MRVLKLWTVVSKRVKVHGSFLKFFFFLKQMILDIMERDMIGAQLNYI
jgi:hypothetical protein